MRTGMVLAALGFSAITMGAPFGVVDATLLQGQILHASGPIPSFDVTTVKPVKDEGIASGFSSGGPMDTGSLIRNPNMTVRAFIEAAFNLPEGADGRILGGPGWISRDRYDIDGKVPESLFAVMRAMQPAQRNRQIELMQQALLADRFKLKAHFETRQLPIYELLLAKRGAKLTPAKEIPTPLSDIPHPAPSPGHPPRTEDLQEGVLTIHKEQGIEMTVRRLSLDDAVLGEVLKLADRPWVNSTGLAGKYDFTLKWTPQRPAMPGTDGVVLSTDAWPSLDTALEEQLGLKLLSTKGPVEVIVIDSIERPSEN